MSSDSEINGPSPLPSPIFARCSPARGTVARKCKEFFMKRLERTASMQKRWSICDIPQGGDQDFEAPSKESGDVEGGGGPPPSEVALRKDEEHQQVDGERTTLKEGFDGYPLRKCRSSFDLAMDSLRKEISSLIAQDNDLFRQLLSLHDSIAELRERQRFSSSLDDDDEDDMEDIDISRTSTCPGHHSHSPSLESLSDPGDLPETSPESTLSSRSSLSATSSDFKSRKHHHFKQCSNHRNRYRKEDGKQRHRATANGKDDSRPLIFIDKSEICFRCRKMAPPYRRSSSITSLYYLHEDMESYDSGIHLQGSHSDSDHEIFV